MKLPVARNRTHIGRETTPDTCPPAETFADELDLFNREELASALEECVFLVTRVESLADSLSPWLRSPQTSLRT